MKNKNRGMTYLRDKEEYKSKEYINAAAKVSGELYKSAINQSKSQYDYSGLTFPNKTKTPSVKKDKTMEYK